MKVSTYSFDYSEGSATLPQVDVIINETPYFDVSCKLLKDSIVLRTNVAKHSVILFDEIVDISGETSSGQNTIVITYYPLFNGRRKQKVVKIMSSRASISSWEKLLREAVKISTPPHRHPMATMNYRKVFVLVNPFSGQQKAFNFWKAYVEPVLKLAHIEYDIRFTERCGDAVTIASSISLDDYDCIVAMSGDGVISELLSGFMLRSDKERALKMPISQIPVGTSNALAAAICYQCNEPFSPRDNFCLESALMVVNPRYLPLRIWNVETSKDGPRVMFMSATWGLVADIDIGSERFRWAGMIRLHMEAVCRISKLPSCARYRARISYLPVDDRQLKRRTLIRHNAPRSAFGTGHFDYEEISNYYNDHTSDHRTAEGEYTEANQNSDRTMPHLNESLPNEWVTFEGEFVFVVAVAISHLGSDLPFVPCSRLGDGIIYLALCDWNTVQSRLQVGTMMITINDSKHLSYPCFQMFPTRGCRIEPLGDCVGFAAIDGEAITPGSSFQVVPSEHIATVVARKEVKRSDGI